jgi:hypothetical protein
MYVLFGSQRLYKVVSVPRKNYAGDTFAAALGLAINDTWSSVLNTRFDVLYDLNDNLIQIAQLNCFDNVKTHLVSGADLQSGQNWPTSISKELIQSMNGVLRLGKSTYMLQETFPYVSYIDLHTTRNLYLTSSCLASYNTISKFENDVIIKQIPVKANYSQMLFDNSGAGYDFLDVSRRALSRLDFRLQDSYGNTVNLRNNHWSFSLVFQIRNWLINLL